MKVLRSLPFRGRISGPYGTRYEYVVKLADGSDMSFSSVRKTVLSLDQYNRDFKSLSLTYDALQRYVARGLTIGGVKVASVERVDRQG